MKRIRVMTVLAAGFVLGSSFGAPAEERLIAKAKKIHENATTLDSHVDIGGARYATAELDPGIDNPRLKCDLVKMRKGGLDGVFLAVYVGQRPALDEAGFKAAYEAAMVKFEAVHRLTETMHPDKCVLVTSPDALKETVKTGKRAIMMGIENGYPIGTDLSLKYPTADLKVFVDHIDHAVKVAGIDHVGIGTDFDGGGGIRGFNDHSEAGNVTVELLRRGYSEKQMRKIWGENLLRVWQDVEKPEIDRP